MTKRRFTGIGPAIAGLCAFLLALPATAREPARAPANRPERSASVKVALWPAPGESLDPAALQARLNGNPARVVSARGPADDLLILVVLDLAGDLAHVDPARQAMIEAITALPPNVWIGLLRAQDGLRVLLDPGPDRERLVGIIRELPISGRAGLLDTLEQAAALGDHLLARSPVRVALLYVTDSSIYNYREDFTNPVVNSSDSGDLSRRFPEGLVKERIQRLMRRVSAQQVPLFIAHLSYAGDRLNEAYQTGLLELAGATGGTAEFCRSVGEIPGVIKRLFDTVQSHYLVELALGGPRPRQALVEVGAGGKPLRHRLRFQWQGH